jgi:hypothetical protein
MIRKTLLTAALAILVVACPEVQAEEPAPSFSEIRDLLKANLVNASDAQLDRAAAEGLLKQVSPQAILLSTGQTAKAEGPALARSTVFDGAFGYVRLARLGPGLAAEMDAAMSALAASNKIKGWVLDLRAANGSDYGAAAEVADRFMTAEQPLLDFGQGMIRSKPGNNPVKGPMVVLVNRRTAGAAEALAAVLRKADLALLLGTNTGGQGFVTKDFPLQTGQKLRIATALVRTGDNEPLPLQGLKPDILIAVNPEEEQLYLEDPYRVLAKPGWSVARSGLEPSAAGTNRASRSRINEADLVRMMKDGEDFENGGGPVHRMEPAGPVLRDPALVRALDLLKGLAVVKRLK